MKCLQWLVDGEVPTPKDLQVMNIVLLQHFALIGAIQVFPPEIAFSLVFRVLFLMWALEEAEKRIKRAIDKAMKENPILAMMLMLMI